MPERTDTCPDPQPETPAAPYAERLSAVVERLRGVEGVEILPNEPMDRHTSLGVGGPVDLYVIVQSVPALCAALAAARDYTLPLLIAGRGTNLLVRDGGFRGMALHLGKGFGALTREGDRVTAQGGATLAEVCAYAAEAGLSGLEFAAGIPGSVGGAIAMNAGAFGGQMADVIEQVEVVDASCQVRRCEHRDLGFDYRHSCLRDKHCVATSVTFRLQPADPDTVRQAALEAISKRCRKQPLSLGSAGSVFKRPPGDYAGRLLEQAGLKGFRIGGASFSRKHANFIVNEGSATAEDIVQLIAVARQRVEEAFGVRLEEEIHIVGDPPPKKGTEPFS